MLLRELMTALEMSLSSSDRLQVVGTERLLSCFHVSELAAAAIGAAGLAASELVASVNLAKPQVTVDRHLANGWFGRSIEPVGWEMPAPWDPIAGDYRTADGWIRLHTNAPAHRSAALGALGCDTDRAAVAEAVGKLDADPLEQAIVDAGGCAATMRTVEAWHAHPQGQAVAQEPLVDWARRAVHGTSRGTPTRARPLAGIKVLDLTRVLAGPVATRFLAGLGADVLRIDPPGWDEPGVVPDVTLGKSCSRLDLQAAPDRRIFEARLSEADILVHGYRPGALDAMGYGPAERLAINPDLIEVTLNAYGWSGPWAARRGFDSLVQMSCGIAAAGMAWRSVDRPVPLPVQALDHATGYLMAAAALRGLAGRLRDGLVASARLSLARTAALLVAAPAGDDGPDFTPSAEDFDTRLEATAWGEARRLRPPVEITDTRLAWETPASPLGSAPAQWHVPEEDE